MAERRSPPLTTLDATAPQCGAVLCISTNSWLRNYFRHFAQTPLQCFNALKRRAATAAVWPRRPAIKKKFSGRLFAPFVILHKAEAEIPKTFVQIADPKSLDNLPGPWYNKGTVKERRTKS